jgi:hypothetical protein
MYVCMHVCMYIYTLEVEGDEKKNRFKKHILLFPKLVNPALRRWRVEAAKVLVQIEFDEVGIHELCYKNKKVALSNDTFIFNRHR